MTYRIKILWDAPWAHWYRAQALVKYAPPDFHVDTGPGMNPREGFSTRPYDLIFMIPGPALPGLVQHLRRYRQLDSTVLVGGVNIGDVEKARHWAGIVRGFGGHPLVNSRAMADALGDDVFHVNNGVDLDKWGVDAPPADRKPRVIWIGSKFHSELVEPGQVAQKGGDTKRYWEMLVPLRERLEARGIECDFRQVESTTARIAAGKIVLRPAEYMEHPELRAWYNSGTVYVVASKTEGTPNPALEAAACGCVVVSTPVGNMPELIDGRNGVLVDHNLAAIEQGVLAAQSNYAVRSALMQKSIEAWSWEAAAARYYALFRRLLPTHQPSAAPAAR